MKFQPTKIELPTTNPDLERSAFRRVIIPGIPTENTMPLYPDLSSFLTPYYSALNFYGDFAGDIKFEFENVIRNLKPDGGSFLDEFKLYDHLVRIYIEEMKELQALGIIEGFDEKQIIGLEKTSFIRASEMDPSNPLLILNPISRIYYLDIGYHKYNGDPLATGSRLEHIDQRHIYEQFEEWGIDDHKELAELILSTIANPHGDFHKMGIIDDEDDPSSIYFRILVKGKVRYLRVIISTYENRRYIHDCFDGKNRGEVLFKDYYNFYNLKDPYNQFN